MLLARKVDFDYTSRSLEVFLVIVIKYGTSRLKKEEGMILRFLALISAIIALIYLDLSNNQMNGNIFMTGVFLIVAMILFAIALWRDKIKEAL
jgi:hypothetical protein